MELNSKTPFLRGGNDPSKFLSGDGSWVNDTKDNTVSFTSDDTANPMSFTTIDVVASGEKHSSLMRKLSQAIKNIRWLNTHKYTTNINDVFTSLNNSYFEIQAVQAQKIANLKTIHVTIKLLTDISANTEVNSQDIAIIKDSYIPLIGNNGNGFNVYGIYNHGTYPQRNIDATIYKLYSSYRLLLHYKSTANFYKGSNFSIYFIYI